MSLQLKNSSNMFISLVIFAFAFLVTFGLGDLSTLHVAHAAACVPKTTNGVINPGGYSNCTSVNTIDGTIKTFAQTIAGIVLGVATLVIVYAGFRYATSNGEPRAVETAKMQIVYAGIGIVVAMLAFVITNVFTSVVGG